MSRADTLATLAVVQQVPILASKTWVSITPSRTTPVEPPYAILHPTSSLSESTRFTSPPVTTNPSFTLHVVGVDADQAQVIVDLLKAQFVTNGTMRPPTVVGRRNAAGFWTDQGVQIDPTVIPATVYAVVELGWRSDPE